MDKINEKDPLEEVFKNIIPIHKVLSKSFDNLFSANHRAAMIRQHGGTQAQIIKIEQLI